MAVLDTDLILATGEEWCANRCLPSDNLPNHLILTKSEKQWSPAYLILTKDEKAET